MGFVGRRPTTVSTPVAPTSVTDFNDIMEFRMSIMNWAGDIMKEIADYLSDFDSAISASTIPNPGLEGATGTELTARNKLQSLAEVIQTRTTTIVDTMLDKLEDIAVNPPTIDIDSLVTLVETAYTKELDENNPLSVYAMREVARSYVSTVLLDSAFELLSGDETEITTTVDIFISRRKSEIDERLYTTERRTFNQLASSSVLDSEIASDAIVRANGKKTRLYGEVDSEAEELRQRLRTDAYQRAFERQKTRIAAVGLLPFQLPPGLAEMINSILLRNYIDPTSFVGNLPQIIGFGVDGFSRLAEFGQRDRVVEAETDVGAINAYSNMVNTISGNLAQVATAIGKFATMEAS